MKKYIPYPFYYDDMPIDISFVFEKEKPAGKHGFLRVDGDRFVFADGAAAKFWGVNINGGACFPDKDYSEKFAKRLAKTGINLVRFHQLDAEWNTPNIFSFCKGKRLENTQSFDEESMDRLDYLMYCLKKEGIYLYLDILTYRKFKTGDGISAARQLVESARPYGGFNRQLIELQKLFAKDLWTHYNPYTELKYCDDPAFVLTEITNEEELFTCKIEVEPYALEFRTRFKEWLKENRISYDADSCDINGKDEPLIQFKIKLQTDYYLEMTEFLRATGVKIPITGTNWTQQPAVLKANEIMDFTDSHTYFYDWRWGEAQKMCMNKAITEVEDGALFSLTEMRMLDKPFFVSEWDMPWPNEYRAESPLLYAAVGAFQGWAGFAIHTYSYGTRLSSMNVLGKECSSSSIGNTPYREGIFSVWNDPAKYGLFYHAALITRRGDVSESSKNAKLYLDSLTEQPKNHNAAAEMLKIGMTFDKSEGDYTRNDKIVDLAAGEVSSNTGELYRSWKKRIGKIDTKMTKCVYGFLAENKPTELKGFTVNAKTDFAVIALSSLTDEDIEGSNNMLMTAVGRAVNSNAKFVGEQMYELGCPPVMIEVIEAEIIIKTTAKNLVVRAVGAEGYYVGEVPSKYIDGELRFTIGETMPSMYYLIQEE